MVMLTEAPEATGGYELLVVGALLIAGLPVVVVNPRQGRGFGRRSRRVSSSISPTLERELHRTDAGFSDVIRQTPAWRERDDVLRSVPGIGLGLALRPDTSRHHERQGNLRTSGLGPFERALDHPFGRLSGSRRLR